MTTCVRENNYRVKNTIIQGIVHIQHIDCDDDEGITCVTHLMSLRYRLMPPSEWVDIIDIKTKILHY